MTASVWFGIMFFWLFVAIAVGTMWSWARTGEWIYLAICIVFCIGATVVFWLTRDEYIYGIEVGCKDSYHTVEMAGELFTLPDDPSMVCSVVGD